MKIVVLAALLVLSASLASGSETITSSTDQETQTDSGAECPSWLYPVWPSLLNLVPGFGAGSFLQGDPVGGWVCVGVSALHIGGWVMVGLSLGWFDYLYNYGNPAGFGSSPFYIGGGNLRDGLYSLGWTVVFGSLLFPVVMPVARHYLSDSGCRTFLNIFPGFGIGSWLQGDFGNAAVMTAVDALSIYAYFINPQMSFLLMGGSRLFGLVCGLDNGSGLLYYPVLNFLPGLGLGSFLQGDFSFGLLELGGDAVAAAIFGGELLLAQTVGGSGIAGAMAGSIFVYTAGTIAVLTGLSVITLHGFLASRAWKFQSDRAQNKDGGTAEVRAEPFIKLVDRGNKRMEPVFGYNLDMAF